MQTAISLEGRDVLSDQLCQMLATSSCGRSRGSDWQILWLWISRKCNWTVDILVFVLLGGLLDGSLASRVMGYVDVVRGSDDRFPAFGH